MPWGLACPGYSRLSPVRLDIHVNVGLGSQQQAAEGNTEGDFKLGDGELQVLGYCLGEDLGAELVGLRSELRLQQQIIEDLDDPV